MDTFVFFLGLTGISLAIYFAPLIVALQRRHRQKLAIGILNFFGGWTGLGWIGAMVWSCTTDIEPPPPPGSPRSFWEDFFH